MQATLSNKSLDYFLFDCGQPCRSPCANAT